jgi:hypothetical protein
MAQQTIKVCDVCGSPAVETVGLKVRGRSLRKDLCSVHLRELTAGARAPKRGRPARSKAAASASSPLRARSTPKEATSKTVTRSRRTR